jgi:hypothetical protein
MALFVTAIPLASVACSATDAGGEDESSVAGAKTSSSPANATAAFCGQPAGIESGIKDGQQIPDYALRDCDGNDYYLSASCPSNAAWLYVAHMWCPHVKQVSSYANEVAGKFAPRGLVSYVVVTESADRNRPTKEDCRAMKEAYGFTDVVTLYDPRGLTMELFDNDTTSLGVYLDANRVIKFRTHTDVRESIERDLEALLASGGH